MSKAVAAARLAQRGNLLRYMCSLGNEERHQFSTIFRRSAHSKTFSKPAPFLTKDVLIDKVMQLSPGWFFLTFVFVSCKIYLGWNLVDYEEIRNYQCDYVYKVKDK